MAIDEIIARPRPLQRYEVIHGYTNYPEGMYPAWPDGHFYPPHRALLCHRYGVEQSISYGTYGTVWKCWDLQESRWVALKVVRNHNEFLHLAREERSTHNTLNNHNQDGHFAEMLDHFMYDNHYCFVFELLPVTLRAFLKTNAECSFVDIAQQLLHALAVLHELDYVHADINPDNIMLVSEQQPIKVKLIDFGSSLEWDDAFPSEPYADIQTLRYRSPEALLGLPIDHKSDIWSLGCTLTELLCDVPLFCTAPTELGILQVMQQIFGPVHQDLIQESYKKHYRRDAQTGQWKLKGNVPSNIFPLSQCLFFPVADETGPVYDMVTDLLSLMLKCDPFDRPSAAELLLHPLFDYMKTLPLNQQARFAHRRCIMGHENNCFLDVPIGSSFENPFPDQLAVVDELLTRHDTQGNILHSATERAEPAAVITGTSEVEVVIPEAVTDESIATLMDVTDDHKLPDHEPDLEPVVVQLESSSQRKRKADQSHATQPLKCARAQLHRDAPQQLRRSPRLLASEPKCIAHRTRLRQTKKINQQ